MEREANTEERGEGERVKRKGTTGMDGDERDDKAGGRIKLFMWVPPFRIYLFYTQFYCRITVFFFLILMVLSFFFFVLFYSFVYREEIGSVINDL